MKKSILILSILFPMFCVAQNEVDALRYSQNFFTGTARSVAMGGAFGALGGDFSTINTNPAGLGIYRSSEFMFTPTFSYNTTSSTYLDGTLDDYKFRMNFSNLGFVGTHVSGKDEGWVTTNFGLGYNRLADFNRYVKIEGVNDSSSMTDYFAQLANGTLYSNLSDVGSDVSFAWDSYLIDPANTDSNMYKSAFSQYGEVQTKDINTKGGMGEYVFSLAGNYSNKLYIGGSIGIQSVRYIEHSDYTESDPKDSINAFESFNYQNDLKTTGAGFNFKLGIIFRPVDWIRIGGAIHTPTFFNLHDEYSSSLKSTFSDNLHGSGNKYETPLTTYDYQLTTPFRAIGSLGFIIGKFALIGVEYEYIDYSNARLRADDYFFRLENNTIQTAYTSTGNIKVGAEIKSGPLSIRGGYGLYGSPFRSGYANENSTRSAYTAGFGIRDDDFFFDMAFSYSVQDEKYFLYDPAPAVNIKTSYMSALATFGFKF
jgi:hypothetical protein